MNYYFEERVNQNLTLESSLQRKVFHKVMNMNRKFTLQKKCKKHHIKNINVTNEIMKNKTLNIFGLSN